MEDVFFPLLNFSFFILSKIVTPLPPIEIEGLITNSFLNKF